MIKVYDNLGESFDRYTVLRTDWPYNRSGTLCQAFGMSDNPTHPQGFGQHTGAQDGPHLGKPIKFEELPSACQLAAKHFLAD